MTVSLRPFLASDAEWLVDRHREIYAREEGYDDSFAELVAQIIADFLANHDPLQERGWVAERAGQRLGSIFCVAEGETAPETAKLRLFLLEADSRGTGLAQTMMAACLDFARAAGYRDMRLWTHESHAAACRLYARNGFACTQSWPERTFGQDVVSQIWEREL